MTLVIPGVEVKVVKEVVAPQLSPSGILGLVGITQLAPAPSLHTSSWDRFIERFGAASAYSLPEASLAFRNGVSDLVVCPVRADTANQAAVDIPAVGDGAETDLGSTAFTIVANVPGPWANGLVITITKRGRDQPVFDLTVSRPGGDILEAYRSLVTDMMDPRNVMQVLAAAPSRIAATGMAGWPKDGTYVLRDGTDASPDDYIDALRVLENDPEVDMVLVAVQDFSEPAKVRQIYSAVISHCERMATISRGRIGFGEVGPAIGPDPAAGWADLASGLLSDRFVLLAPNGVAGAVAGMVGSLSYFESPTFNTLTGVTALSRALVVEEQKALLLANVVPVITQRGRGTIVVRGLTTDGDQISVRRVADRAVRGVSMIGDLFIGRLNNELGRNALKQKLMEFLVQMERDGAIVPSTDGLDPAFKVNVYSSQDDFAKGIVRVDLAVRPVRAIDFIYATVLVQV